MWLCFSRRDVTRDVLFQMFVRAVCSWIPWTTRRTWISEDMQRLLAALDRKSCQCRHFGMRTLPLWLHFGSWNVMILARFKILAFKKPDLRRLCVGNKSMAWEGHLFPWQFPLVCQAEVQKPWRVAAWPAAWQKGRWGHLSRCYENLTRLPMHVFFGQSEGDIVVTSLPHLRSLPKGPYTRCHICLWCYVVSVVVMSLWQDSCNCSLDFAWVPATTRGSGFPKKTIAYKI